MPNPGPENLQHLSKYYTNPESTKTHIHQALMHYRGLMLKVDSFVLRNGEKKDLVCLDGTIPVPYKGTIYNIPVCIWIMEGYPYHAPVCFVKPTADMQIKVSRHVDPSGRIYLPYLHDWKSNSSELVGLIQIMIVVFGEQPPVYAKPRSHSDHSSSHSSHSPYSSQQTGSSSYMPMPSVTGTSQNSPYSYPSYPPSTNPYSSSTPGYQYSRVSTGNYSASGGGGGAYSGYNPTPAPAYPPPYPPCTTGSYSSTTTPYSTYTPTPMPQPSSAPTITNTITEEHIKASLLSAVEDKMKRRLREMFSQIQAEMDVLKQTQEDLNRGKAKLEDIINKLEAEQNEIEKNAVILQEKNSAMSEVIAKLQSEEALDIDEAVVTTTPLYKQLLNAFAEENATEDAIYYLGEALRRGIIDLDLFLKHVRELSRKQFMLRALMQKCREKANLPC